MSIPDFSLAGQVAIITGGRRGIGKTIALAFAESGADVGLCDLVIDDGYLEGVAEEIRGIGRRSMAVQADISIKSEVENVAQKVMDEFGKIDILVNNAGLNIAKSIMHLAENEWDKVMDIDLKGYFLFSQAVGKHMIKNNKGNIISLASQLAFRTAPNMGIYSIAKAGVVMLTRVLARELGCYNIRANAIAPGMVKTEFNRQNWTNSAFMEQMADSIPLGQVAETTDLVGTALFLASEASAHITGHTLLVDGGRMA
ncbi:SDR family NAD(P)-dependent oxidoreductase [Thermodesulfobacteriota bacterium]